MTKADKVLWGELAGDARLVQALRAASAQVADFVARHPRTAAQGSAAAQ